VSVLHEITVVKPARTFEDLYREHGAYVRGLALRLTGHSSDADDLLQETFIRAWRHLDGFAGGSMRSWLRRILVNRFLTRVQAQRPQVSFEEDAPVMRDVRDDPAERIEHASLDDRVQLALDGLPEEFRTALVLREIEDLTYDQIASLLSVPIGTVRSRLARARALMRVRLGGAG